MIKHVEWEQDVVDPIVKRMCLCEGCPSCRNRTGMYCEKFGHQKCTECKDYRCDNCLFNNEICNYCKRIA